MYAYDFVVILEEGVEVVAALPSSKYDELKLQILPIYPTFFFDSSSFC